MPEDAYAPGPRAERVSADWSACRRARTSSTGSDRGGSSTGRAGRRLLEFYGIGIVHLRGSLRIGLVRVLRDDLSCDPGGPKDGIGYSVLASSRDGITWQRRREPFLDRNPASGSWDHAMTWIGAAVPVGDEVFFYYGGYARGHKVGPATERQIGLARMKRDRYLGLGPSNDEGRFVTRPLRLVPDGRLTVNARATRGRSSSDCSTRRGDPLDDLGPAEARLSTATCSRARCAWQGSMERLRGKPMRSSSGCRGRRCSASSSLPDPARSGSSAVGRPLPTCGSRADVRQSALPDKPGRTSFTNPAIPYTGPDEAAVLSRGEVETVVVATGPSSTASSAGIAPGDCASPRSGTADVARTCSSRPRPG